MATFAYSVVETGLTLYFLHLGLWGVGLFIVSLALLLLRSRHQRLLRRLVLPVSGFVLSLSTYHAATAYDRFSPFFTPLVLVCLVLQLLTIVLSVIEARHSLGQTRS